MKLLDGSAATPIWYHIVILFIVLLYEYIYIYILLHSNWKSGSCSTESVG